MVLEQQISSVYMLKATLIYGLASMLPSLLGFLLLPLYSKYLTPAEYGIVAAMGVLSSVIAAVSTLALDRAAMRFYFDSDDLQSRKENMGTFFLGSIGSALIFFIILIALKPFLEQLYPDIAFYPYYFSTIITVTAGVCGNFVLSYFRVAEKALSFLVMIILTVILQLVLTYYFIVVQNMGAEGQILSMLISTMMLLPVYLKVAYRDFSFKFNWELIKKGFSFSWPLIPTMVVAWILNWSDGIFIANYASMNDVGVYAMGYKISMLIFVVSGSFSTAYSPIFFTKANQQDQVNARESIYSIVYYASRVFICIGFILALFSFDIVRIFLDERYYESYKIIRIVLWAHVLSAIMGISSNLFYQQTKRNKLQLVVVSFAAGCSLILNYIFVPVFGIYGAAYVNVASMAVLTLMHYQFSRSCYFIDIHWHKLLLLIGCAISIVWCIQITVEESIYSFQIKLLLILPPLIWILLSIYKKMKLQRWWLN